MKITKNTEEKSYVVNDNDFIYYGVSQKGLWDMITDKFKNGDLPKARAMYKAMDRESRVMLLESLALAEYNPGLTEDQLSSLFEVLID